MKTSKFPSFHLSLISLIAKFIRVDERKKWKVFKYDFSLAVCEREKKSFMSLAWSAFKYFFLFKGEIEDYYKEKKYVFMVFLLKAFLFLLVS
mgnify:CR=1 FL=1